MERPTPQDIINNREATIERLKKDIALVRQGASERVIRAALAALVVGLLIGVIV